MFIQALSRQKVSLISDPTQSRPVQPLFGLLSANPKGFAFVRLDDGGPDVFIPPKSRMGAQHGERVGIELDASDAAQPPSCRSGRVVQLPERAPEWIGHVVQTDSGFELHPIDPRCSPVALAQAPEEALGAIVLAHLTMRPRGVGTGEAVYVRTLGQGPTAPVINAIVSHAHGLPGDFPEAVLQEAQAMGDAVQFDPSAMTDRKDLRALPFCTIDGASSKDLDDALWAQVLPDGTLRLLVAIADVAHYVRPGSAIDDEAQKRTTSVYLPGSVNPMLPNALSQGLCSLNPHVDRFCVVCEMDIDANGAVASSRFYKAIMRSQARLTYSDVESHLFQGLDAGVPLPGHWSSIASSMTALRRVYERLAQARATRGAMDFSSNEVALSFNAGGVVRGIYKPARTNAHRLVEETMVAANVQAAKTLHDRAHDSLFRAHGAPPEKKHATLNAMLGARGIQPISDLGSVHAGELSALTQAHPHLASAILRAQDKARYETKNAGHFGLGLDHYAHFTSPIRRYPDLVMHRVLVGEAQPDLEMLAQACSEGERRATAAEREAVDRLRTAYLSGKEGERFAGVIESVTRMGAFVCLGDTAASGLLPLACFGENAVLDEVAQHIIDEHGVEWGLGDGVEVALAAADWKTSRIEFAAPAKPVLALHVAPRL